MARMMRTRATLRPPRLLAPRIALLAGGTLAMSLSNWTASASGDSRHPWGTIATLTLLLGGIALLLVAVCRPAPWRPPATHQRGYRLATFALLAALGLSVAVSVGLAATTIAGAARSTTVYNSDAAAFNAYNAELALHGTNPYTADARFWDALRRFPNVGTTPLRRGRYASSTYGPSLEQVVRDVHAELADPTQRGPEFAPASLHSYPALAFLVYLPGVWAGQPTTLLTSLLFALALLLAAGWDAPRRQRVLIAALLLGNQFLLVATLRGSFEVVALLPALLAWRWLDRPRLSAALLGLACAVKQIAWPLAPLYLVVIWRRDGARAALSRLPVLAAAFLLPNLPFLLAAPGAWATSMLLPVTLPIFPSGIGLIALPKAGLLPLWPAIVYSLLEGMTLLALVLWFARARRMPRLEVALVVGLLPLLLAWHSLGAYFLLLPTLAVYASLPLLRADVTHAPAASNI